MTKLWFLLSLWLMTACMPEPDSKVQRASPELSIKGRVLHSSETLSGSTAIYVEQSPTAEAMTAEDGSFAFTFDAARLDALRLEYGLQDSRLNLYFMSENGSPESAVVSVVDIQARGEWNLGDVQLQPEVPVSGRVVAFGAPVADARVRLGRREIMTDADGSFTSTVPAELATPLLVEKRGFVQTKGSWLADTRERAVELYTDLTPVGAIEAKPVPRNLANAPILLSYSANRAAFWIRFGRNPEALSRNFEADSPWLDLRKPLQILNPGVVYYQFADRDQKILGPVFSYTPSEAGE